MRASKKSNNLRTNLLILTDQEVNRYIKESNFLFGGKTPREIIKFHEINLSIENPSFFSNSTTYFNHEKSYFAKNSWAESINQKSFSNNFENPVKKSISRKKLGIINKQSIQGNLNSQAKLNSKKNIRFFKKTESLLSNCSKNSLFSNLYDDLFIVDEERIVKSIQKSFHYLQNLCFSIKKPLKNIFPDLKSVNNKKKYNEELFMILEMKDLKFDIESQITKKEKLRSFSLLQPNTLSDKYLKSFDFEGNLRLRTKMVTENLKNLDFTGLSIEMEESLKNLHINLKTNQGINKHVDEEEEEKENSFNTDSENDENSEIQPHIKKLQSNFSIQSSSSVITNQTLTDV